MSIAGADGLSLRQGVMLVIVAIGLLADRVIFSPWERFLHRRSGTNVQQS